MAVEPETMEELLAGIDEDEPALRLLLPGEVVEGVVASVGGDEALVDLGGRFAGVLSLQGANGEGTDVTVGDRVVAAWSNLRGRTAASSSPRAARGARGSGRG